PSSSFLVSCSAAHRPLHSFPTRRSSDLCAQAQIDPRELVGLSGRRWILANRLQYGPRVDRSLPTNGYIFEPGLDGALLRAIVDGDRKSTRLNSSHVSISYAVFCLKKKKQ